MIEKRLIIAAAGRNCEKYLPSVFENIKRISKMFKDVRCIFVESDSVDNTVKIMQEFNTEVPTEVYSLGELSSRVPIRTGRIACARNFYLTVIEKNYSYYDLLLVLDLDEVNSEPITEKEIYSNFEYQEWDMICANQGQKYYDLWALRHPTWMPVDCWEQFHHKPKFISRDDAFNMYIRSKFIHIPESTPLIQVQSAFGGAAFIKISSITGARHTPINERGEETCEWPSFCTKLNNGNPIILINPRYIIQRSKSEHIN